MAALKAGKVDAVVADIDPATAITAKDADVEMLPEPLSKEDYAVAVRKGNAELLAVANRVIERIKASGEYDKFREEAQARFEAINQGALGQD
ncbi:MAG: transporter substrate-binding domain-containing protein [Kiritimatiellae bacterium]|nr:transporter substrate-binding domain-containing protein [Kiritimatiellia bacterium]